MCPLGLKNMWSLEIRKVITGNGAVGQESTRWIKHAVFDSGGRVVARRAHQICTVFVQEHS